MGKNFLSQAERSQITLTSELKNILIGLLLGDLYLQKTPKSTKITFAVLFKELLTKIMFSIYMSCSKITNAPVDKRTGKTFSGKIPYLHFTVLQRTSRSILC